jgi:DNA-binding response OmpR family regulator
MSDFNIARPRVLVADPDPETSALIARQLEWSGYEVTTVANGRDALDLIGRLRPAAAVLEVKMDVMTGYDVVRSLRENARTQKLPIVMISARAGKLDRDFAFTVGADDYVKKPFHSSELVARLGLLLPASIQPPSARPALVKPAGDPAPQPMRRAERRRPVSPVARRPLTPVLTFSAR